MALKHLNAHPLTQNLHEVMFLWQEGIFKAMSKRQHLLESFWRKKTTLRKEEVLSCSTTQTMHSECDYRYITFHDFLVLLLTATGSMKKALEICSWFVLKSTTLLRITLCIVVFPYRTRSMRSIWNVKSLFPRGNTLKPEGKFSQQIFSYTTFLLNL